MTESFEPPSTVTGPPHVARQRPLHTHTNTLPLCFCAGRRFIVIRRSLHAYAHITHLVVVMFCAPARRVCVNPADEELLSILRGKLRREHLTAGVDALMAAADVLRKKRKTASHFGNGGEVANLLSEAKLRKENRRKDGSLEARCEAVLTVS